MSRDFLVEERMRACDTLLSALHYFARWANEPLVRDVPGCRPEDLVQMTPGFCHALREHVASIQAVLPAEAQSLPCPSAWRRP